MGHQDNDADARARTAYPATTGVSTGLVTAAMDAEPTTVASSQVTAGVTPREAPVDLPGVLDQDQHTLLTAILDRLVPARAGLAGAGGLGGAAVLDRTLAASPALRRLFFDGMMAIDMASVGDGNSSPNGGFVELSPEDQRMALRSVELALPSFFAALVDHAYRGYYTRPEVQRVLGYANRPPQPDGQQLPPFNVALLNRQRLRLPFWRRTR